MSARLSLAESYSVHTEGTIDQRLTLGLLAMQIDLQNQSKKK
ncbi:MAG TPA: hypothetical protein V6C82_10340 [Chroococcales cyanobacterium]